VLREYTSSRPSGKYRMLNEMLTVIPVFHSDVRTSYALAVSGGREARPCMPAAHSAADSR